MKKCCKSIDITDINFIIPCIMDCFKGKWKRKEVRNLLIAHDPTLTKGQINFYNDVRDYYPFRKAIKHMALEVSHNIKNHSVSLPPTHSFIRVDSNSGKGRKLTQETMEHQVYEYIAVNGLEELLHKKVSPNQIACIKKRGEKYGVQKT